MKRGVSLLEIVVAVGLIALMIPFVLNLIPSGTIALKHAESVEVGTAYAWKLIEEARSMPDVTGKNPDRARVRVGGTGMVVTREFFSVDDRLRDVVVTIECERGGPIRLATRMAVAETP